MKDIKFSGKVYSWSEVCYVFVIFLVVLGDIRLRISGVGILFYRLGFYVGFRCRICYFF